jgi:hypothetical protein
VKLSPFQRKVLLRYKGFIARPPTPLRIFATALPQILILIALVIFSAYTLSTTATAFCGGLCVGAIVYQVAFSLRVVKSVATLVEFLDWQRVDQALAGTENDER